MAKLDDLVTTALVGRLLTTERVQEILSGLVARRQSRVGPAQVRIQALASEVADAEARLKRLYASIEAGIADLSDGTLKQRLDDLRADRDRARAALERLREQTREPVTVTPEQVDTFARVMRSRLQQGEVPFRKAYLRAIIDSLEVAQGEVRITGSPDVLEKAVANGANAAPGVRSSVRESRASDKARLPPQRYQPFSISAKHSKPDFAPTKSRLLRLCAIKHPTPGWLGPHGSKIGP